MKQELKKHGMFKTTIATMAAAALLASCGMPVSYERTKPEEAQVTLSRSNVEGGKLKIALYNNCEDLKAPKDCVAVKDSFNDFSAKKTFYIPEGKYKFSGQLHYTVKEVGSALIAANVMGFVLAAGLGTSFTGYGPGVKCSIYQQPVNIKAGKSYDITFRESENECSFSVK